MHVCRRRYGPVTPGMKIDMCSYGRKYINSILKHVDQHQRLSVRRKQVHDPLFTMHNTSNNVHVNGAYNE